MQTLKTFPLTAWAYHHPRFAAWIVLSLGMVALLVLEARNVGLLLTQWVALITATVLVAGLCVWIISWEDDNEHDAPAANEPTNIAPTDTPPTESA